MKRLIVGLAVVVVLIGAVRLDGAIVTPTLNWDAALDTAGDQIRVQWDATTCTSSDYNILFGNLEDVATYELLGGECQIGIAGGPYDWLDVPEGNLFFLIVGTDETGIYESSWREDSFGEYRNGGKASFQCGATTKIVFSICL